mmetsp:Transcript_8559/g.15063  ORF Transcript_8559/g.15063 Transcript_8559/m.15063 type:complete len:220 (-) Transcript_8559:568-1227(-)
MEPEMFVAEARSGDQPLHSAWVLWFMQRPPSGPGRAVGAEDYEKSIKPIGKFETVEGFWQIYNHIKRPAQISGATEFHLFRAGVKPIWEDPTNQHGGKLTVRIVKGLSSRLWECVLLALIGEQFDAGDDITGAVISLRPNEDVIAVWNKSADNHAALSRIRDNLRVILNLPGFVRSEYKRHEKRMRTAARPGLLNASSPGAAAFGAAREPRAAIWRGDA